MNEYRLLTKTEINLAIGFNISHITPQNYREEAARAICKAQDAKTEKSLLSQDTKELEGIEKEIALEIVNDRNDMRAFEDGEKITAISAIERARKIIPLIQTFVTQEKEKAVRENTE